MASSPPTTARVGLGAVTASREVEGATHRLVLPFDAYRFTDDDRMLIERARSLLITTCMRRHGFDDFAFPTGADETPPVVPANSRRYGVASIELAARFGYHLPPDPAATRRADSYDEWDSRLTATQREVLDGRTGSGGCAGEAEKTLRRGVRLGRSGWFTPLDFQSLRRSATDPRVRAATARWRTCTAARGMSYASPMDALADPRWNLDTPLPSRQEITAATIDVRCKARVRLVETWVTVESGLQRTLVAQRSRDFVDLDRGNKRYLANASAVVDTIPHPRPTR